MSYAIEIVSLSDGRIVASTPCDSLADAMYFLHRNWTQLQKSCLRNNRAMVVAGSDKWIAYYAG